MMDQWNIRKLIGPSIAGVLIEVFAILSFIGISKTALAVPGKDVILALFAACIIILLVSAMSLLSFKELIMLAFTLTIGLIAAYQIIGFSCFGGLVKGLIPFSFDHLIGTGELIILVFSAYLGTICMILGVKKLLKI